MSVYVNLKLRFEATTEGDQSFGPYHTVLVSADSARPGRVTINGETGMGSCACATLDAKSGLWAIGQPDFGGGRYEFRYLQINDSPDVVVDSEATS